MSLIGRIGLHVETTTGVDPRNGMTVPRMEADDIVSQVRGGSRRDDHVERFLPRDSIVLRQADLIEGVTDLMTEIVYRKSRAWFRRIHPLAHDVGVAQRSVVMCQGTEIGPQEEILRGLGELGCLRVRTALAVTE